MNLVASAEFGVKVGGLRPAGSGEIDKNFLFVGRSILSAVLCVKSILPQDVGCCMDDTAEGIWQNSFY